MDQSTVDPAKAGRGRSTGVLLHPTALPGSPVCGSFGEPCRRWLQLLANHGIGVWQMLPLAPPDPTGSPYSSPSCNALNPWFLDGQDLANEGFIGEEALRAAPGADAPLEGAERVEFNLAQQRATALGMPCLTPGLSKIQCDMTPSIAGRNSSAAGCRTMPVSRFCTINTTPPGGSGRCRWPGMTTKPSRPGRSNTMTRCCGNS